MLMMRQPRPKLLRADPQLNIYAKAAEEIKGELPAKATLFYLEKDRMVEYSIINEWVEEVTKPIIHIAKKILVKNFEPIPSYQTCRFCPYSRICDVSAVGA